MKTELRILVIEDVISDVVLINRELRKGGLSFRTRRVETRPEFSREMERHPPDLILSDHGVPAFDGFTALSLTRQGWPELPFIFVSGAQNEPFMARAYENGATDYVLKSRMFHLVPAIRRAMREVEERDLRRRIEADRDHLRHELQQAMGRVKRLNGLLPVCAKCNRAREDEHYWKELREYLREPGHGTLEESLCPDCSRHLARPAINGTFKWDRKRGE